ncbi:metallophosphoesterase family protein [Haloarchaeobius sp. HME9146]|uniref:metallophosphoesterase family protein n=1 Tax=Haloarchaeobius sp. HME9146 TaxID=2978732 RepID=UPI0021C1629D|nr:metallophosphoesterase family protein [Haloarchaeobius sp. HME9146]MCT9097635.1 serine/threonine protein phosphatase [Haloarchaeobius sp. HME9146]
MHPPRFGDAVSRQHRRVDPAGRDVYIVGDVHGCLEALEALLDTLAVDADDLVVFVGDLVTRGPDSAGVVSLVRESPNMVAVRGNTEQNVLDGTVDAPDLSQKQRQWLASLPVALSWDDLLVVHGGIDPRKPLASHVPADLMEPGSLAASGTGRPYWWEFYSGPHRVFFGHRVFSAPLVSRYAVGLDTGCVYGNQLTAFDCTAGRTVSVPAAASHRERDPGEYIDPAGFG